MTRPRSTTSSRDPPRARSASRLPLPAGAARAGSRSSPARRAGSGARRCGGSPPTGSTWSRSTAPTDDPRLPYALGTVAELQRSGASGWSRSPPTPADAEALAGAVEIAERRWGGLDVIVAAAGVIAGGVPAWELDAEQERAVLEVNLGGVLTAARVGVPALLRRPAAARGPLHRRRLAPPPRAACRCSPPTARPRRA